MKIKQKITFYVHRLPNGEYAVNIVDMSAFDSYGICIAEVEQEVELEIPGTKSDHIKAVVQSFQALAESMRAQHEQDLLAVKEREQRYFALTAE